MTLTVDELRLDLALAFPDMQVEALTEGDEYLPGPKLVFANQVLLPDLWPVYIREDQLEGRVPLGYTGRVHDAFRFWLARRGWQVFGFDGPSYLVLVTTEDILAAAARLGQSVELPA